MPNQTVVNRLADELERGQISVRDFIRGASRAAAGSPGIGPLIRATRGRRRVASAARSAGPALREARPIQRTGLVVRIQQVSEEQGNLIEGIVRPGVTEFWQSFSQGSWTQTITSGTAVINVNGTERSIGRGEEIVIQAGDRFMFLNRSETAWRFEARHPMWQPELFTYEFRRRRILGNEMWFELKTSPDDQSRRPTYNVLSLDGRGTFVVILVEPGSRMIRQRNTDGPNVVTVLAGAAGVRIAGGRWQGMARADSMRIANDEPFLENRANAMSLVEVRPDPPRFWNPDASRFELASGRFTSGERVWFEYVLPVEG